MLVIDDLTIIICGILVMLALASVLADSFLRKVKVDETIVERADLQPVSVIIIADNNSRELDKNLPAYLSQNYPAGYEVIVVVSKNEDNIDDMLKSYSGHDNLYTTFLPDSSRYMSRRKLAVTLGVKAAKNELILLADAECHPNTDNWIHAMASAGISNNAGMVIGYSNYDAGIKHFYMFERMFREFAFMREAANGSPYAMAGNNLLFRKSIFMEGKGYQGNLKYLRGEYEFLVNKYGYSHNVAVATDLDCFLTENVPTKNTFTNKCVFYAETRRHLERGLKHRLSFNADMLFLHLNVLVAVLCGVFGGLAEHWLVLLVSILSLLVPLITRTITARRAAHSVNFSLHAWCVVPYEMRLVWHNFATFCRYKRADKTDFISHKS